ncbi:MAG: steroid 3-ketoacyl-CoA thiolase [Actinobacteria bacterium]|nr:steroid 3-ketoacyl-CoA thiolase [Actinomycetota bacterium]MCL6105079.1 steroid 3-ketoacyl-CoA thiolase [Actinomycetota bacterium]
MDEVLIIDAVRTPLGKRGGGLSTCHSADLLGLVQSSLFVRSNIDPTDVGQVFGGCISQAGMQSFNVTRNGWLSAGLPETVPSTTLDSQCGSSQQATSVAAAHIGAGLFDVAVSCGVEIMSRVPLGSNISQGIGKPMSAQYRKRYEATTQFEAAERIAKLWNISRFDTDNFGVVSQERAKRAWDEGRFDTQIIPVDAPELDENGKPTEKTKRITRDEGLRDTTFEGLQALKPVLDGGIHTAGTSSQITDGASAMLLCNRDYAVSHRLTPRARIVDSCLVATDPVIMLTGPIAATHRLLKRNDLTISDVDVFENNEAFASVVLAWMQEFKADPERVNPCGGAIALGHALGSTGVVLLTKALYELERTGSKLALITMCCGGGLGTGTLIERI